MQAPAAPVAPEPHLQHKPHRSRLRARDLLRDFEQDGHEVYNSPQANPRAALAALGQLEDLLQYGVFKLISASPPLRSKKEALDTADQLQALTLGADQNTLASDVATLVPLSLWLKRDEVKTK
jgi:hypothetical protein